MTQFNIPITVKSGLVICCLVLVLTLVLTPLPTSSLPRKKVRRKRLQTDNCLWSYPSGIDIHLRSS